MSNENPIEQAANAQNENPIQQPINAQPASNIEQATNAPLASDVEDWDSGSPEEEGQWDEAVLVESGDEDEEVEHRVKYLDAMKEETFFHQLYTQGGIGKINTYLTETPRDKIDPSINAANENGDTLLHLAAKNGDFLLMRLLLEKGANPFLLNGDNKTAKELIVDQSIKGRISAAFETAETFWNRKTAGQKEESKNNEPAPNNKPASSTVDSADLKFISDLLQATRESLNPPAVAPPPIPHSTNTRINTLSSTANTASTRKTGGVHTLGSSTPNPAVSPVSQNTNTSNTTTVKRPMGPGHALGKVEEKTDGGENSSSAPMRARPDRSAFLSKVSPNQPKPADPTAESKAGEEVSAAAPSSTTARPDRSALLSRVSPPANTSARPKPKAAPASQAAPQAISEDEIRRMLSVPNAATEIGNYLRSKHAHFTSLENSSLLIDAVKVVPQEEALKQVIKVLLQYGAKVDVADKNKVTPLHIAAHKGYGTIVTQLIKAGAARDAEDKKGLTPEQVAAKAGHKELAQELAKARQAKEQAAEQASLDQKLSLQCKDLMEFANTALKVRVRMSLQTGQLQLLPQTDTYEELEAFLRKAEIDWDKKNSKGQTLQDLLKAEENELLGEVCRVAVEKKLPLSKALHLVRPPSASKAPGLPPLHAAIHHKDLPEIKALLDEKREDGQPPADPNAQDPNTLQAAPLHLAVQKCPEAVGLLLAANANPNVSLEDGVTPLHLAVQKNDLLSAQLLLEAKADPNAQATKKGMSPLHIAGRDGHEELAELLIHAKANPEILNNEGQTAAQMAQRAGKMNVATDLVKMHSLVKLREGDPEEKRAGREAAQAVVVVPPSVPVLPANVPVAAGALLSSSRSSAGFYQPASSQVSSSQQPTSSQASSSQASSAPLPVTDGGVVVPVSADSAAPVGEAVANSETATTGGEPEAAHRAGFSGPAGGQ